MGIVSVADSSLLRSPRRFKPFLISRNHTAAGGHHHYDRQAANQRAGSQHHSSPCFNRPAGAGRVIAREHRAQHAPRIPREGVVFREPPDMAGGPVFSAQRRVARPQSLGWRRSDYP